MGWVVCTGLFGNITRLGASIVIAGNHFIMLHYGDLTDTINLVRIVQKMQHKLWPARLADSL